MKKILFLLLLLNEACFGRQDTPPITQASIDRALQRYLIQIPKNCPHPKLNLTLEERGLTSYFGRNFYKVEIGPPAFSSWGMLGSTLAHELEIHCNQNFLKIRVLDLLGQEATKEAERQAYLYEIENAKRFGLKEKEVRSIKATMEYYYP